MTTQPSRPKWVLPALTASIAVTLMAAAFLFRPRSGLEILFAMPAFELTNQAGQAVSSSSLRGKITVVSLIYTSCTDICPATTMKMRQVQQRLTEAGALGKETMLLSITVDPERDTPQVLAGYATRYGADTAGWHFLTGSPDYVRESVIKGFYLHSEKVTPASHQHDGGAPASYEVTHSDRVLLVDKSGQIRAIYSVSDLDLNRIVSDVKSLR